MSKPRVILLDLFSGIGGFAVGFDRAGLNLVQHFFSEVDRNAIAVYRYQFKQSQYVGSVINVQSISKRVNKARAEHPDATTIVTFGSPCQDFSLAGSRRGLEGQRSGLIQCAIDILKRVQPDLYIWENVKGTYSSNAGADHWAIQQAFANIHGYRREQQLLNTAWFLPQNRERLYLIGHAAKASTRNVFPFSERDQRSFERRQQQVRTETGLLKIRSATKSGFETATTGDALNINRTKSKTRRGRVGKATAQTLETVCNQAVILPSRQQNMNGRRVKNVDEPAFALTAMNDSGVTDGYKIRRFTEVEFERLQGFPDNWTAKGVKPRKAVLKYINIKRRIFKDMPELYDTLTAYAYGYLKPAQTYTVSSTQRYKQCGNAVSTCMPEKIAARAFSEQLKPAAE